MAGPHVRCTEDVHRKLKQIAIDEGVSLSQALEILVSTVPPGGRTAADSAPGDPPRDPAADQRVADLERQLAESQAPENELLEQLSLTAGEEEHAHSPECPQCRQMAEEAYQKGRLSGITQVETTPGVIEARQFSQECQRHNEEHPTIPVEPNWAEIPGVQEALENYRFKKTPIRIIDDSVPTNGSSAPPGQAPQNQGSKVAAPEYQLGSRVLEDGSTTLVKVATGTGGHRSKTGEYTELVRFSRGPMAGTEAYFRPQELHPATFTIRQ